MLETNYNADTEEEPDVPPPTTALSGQIKAIGKDTVHKICSGQVRYKIIYFSFKFLRPGLNSF